LPSLASRRINNLFFAGQINRTTGYEEAAAQGFIAGVNAARHVLERDPFVLSRQDAYIGVLIDDLITKGTNEPYRMFTSRSERRLILRQDNARFRLFKQAQSLGLVDRIFLDETAHFVSLIDQEEQRLTALHENGVHFDRILARPGTRYRDLPDCNCSLPSEVIEQIEIRMKYHGYILQEERAADRARRDEAMLIPASMDYWKIETLRYEAREKFDKQRPISVAQASRIPGITPSDIITLTIALKKT